MRRRASIVFAMPLCLSCSLPDAVRAQQSPPLVAPQQPQPQLPLHIVIQGVPGAAETAAPDWIKPGTRLVFFSASATTQDAAGAVTLVPDPNGDIKDDKGNRFREKGGTTMGGGGAGYMIVDVVASEPPPNGVIVLQTSMYTLLNGMQSPAMLASSWGEAIHPSGCDWFLHPRLLNQLQPIDSGGVSVMRHTMERNGSDYDCVRVSFNGAGRTSYVYDLASGVLLSHNGSLGFKGTTVYQRTGDTYNPPTSSGTRLVMNRFISAREINVPWRNQRMPPWARTMKKARYHGAITMKGPANSGVADVSLGMTAELVTTYVGGTFSVYQMSVSQETAGGFPQGPPSTTVLVSGPASIGGFWMDPAALRHLRTGQVIDNDPTLGSRTIVEFAGQRPNGQSIVVITATSQVQNSSSTYDATDGRLIAVSKTDFYPETGFSNLTQLQLVGME